MYESTKRDSFLITGREIMSEDKKLFKIGEVAKTIGVTRKMILNYENLGLINPSVIKDGSGFRYYTADDIVHIRIIRVMQNLGLSLAEIRDYFHDTNLLGEQIDRLVKMRNQLDQQIAQLRLRQSEISAKEVRHVTLPAFTGFCRKFHTDSIQQKTDDLRQTYIDAMQTCRLDMNHKMFNQISISDSSEGMYVVPVLPESRGSNIRSFSEKDAICIYYRGPYENFPDVYERLLRYADENGLIAEGYFRNCFLEGPPTHGANKEAYMTQVTMPVRKCNSFPENDISFQIRE